MIIRSIRILHVFLILSLFVLASCGAKKKVVRHVENRPVYKVPDNTSSTGWNPAISQRYADLLGVNEKDLNIDLYNYIENWMGVPHRLGGLSKDGIDCSAFVGFVYKEVYRNILPRSSKEMAEIVKRKYDHQLKEGDLVFFSFGGKVIDHVGIYLHNDKFVHVSTSKGVIISNLKDAWYYKFLTRCGTPII